MDSLYVSDLDGTLLDRRGNLSDYSRETLRRLLGEGLVFTVATARSVVSIRQKLGNLPLTLPVIEFNGAFLSELQTGRHEHIHGIHPDYVESLLEILTDHGHFPFVSSFDGESDRLYYSEIRNDGMAYYLKERQENKDPRLCHVSGLNKVLGDAIVCFTVIGNPKQLFPLEKAVRAQNGDQVETHCYEDPYNPGWHWLTIHDHKATKDRAIQALRERYGLKDRELVVFGDHINDIKMLKGADRSIAVENAMPELKAHAQFMIGSNEEDSVVRFIEKDWKGPRPD